MKKIIALMLCFLMILFVGSITAFADNFGDNKVLFEGDCGFSEVDSVYYRYYDDGIMVISGNGVVGQITIPEWFTKMWCIQIENGITGIVNTAFKIWNMDRCRLCRIDLPLSIETVGVDILPKEELPYHKVAICYPGSKEQWETIRFGNSSESSRSFNKQNCIIYLNNNEPKPFIGFDCDSKVLNYESGESVNVYLNYYLGEYQDAIIKIEKDEKTFNGLNQVNDLRQVGNSFIMSSSYGENCFVNATLLLPDENITLSRDSLNIIIDKPEEEELFRRMYSFLHVDLAYLIFASMTSLLETFLIPYYSIKMIINEIIIVFERFFYE